MSAHARCLVLLWMAVVLGQVGCQRGVPNAASPAPAMKVTGAPITEAEAEEFADRMTQAVAARDAAAIDRLVRMGELGERLVSDLGMPAVQRKAFLEGMSNSLQKAGIGQQILKSIEGGGSYKLLRIRTLDGRPRPLFRLIGSDGAFNYHEYTLARHKDGQVGAEDMYVYASAESISQTLRRLIIPTLASRPGMGGLNKIDPQEVSRLEAFGTMGKAARSGDFKSAVAAYRKLPKKSQEQKPILLMYMLATSHLGADGEADCLAAMQLFHDQYPNDAANDFISINFYFLQKRYAAARKSIEELDQTLGGDPFLDVMRGNAWMEEGRFDEARQAMEEAIQKESDLANAYWARITLSLRENKHDDTLLWLQTVVEKCSDEVESLSEVPEYAEFVKSPQHGEWKKWYAGRGKGNE